MKESALRFGKDRSLVGILTENGDTNFGEKNNSTAVLFLNSGLLHHVGPNRIYVKVARRLTANRFVALRFDFSGVGDSSPRRDKLPAVESVIDEARQAMDYLGYSKGINQFCCVGLCGGAVTAARVSLCDPRVRKLILINLPLPKTHHRFVVEQSNIYFRYALFSVRSWLRFFSMRSNYLHVWQVVSAKIRGKVFRSSLYDSESQDATSKLKKFFRSIRMQGVRILMVNSGLEFGDEYFKTVLGDEYHAMQNSGLLRIERIAGADHAISPLSCQEELLDLISDFLTERS
jgi:pimeloyl-ACP methyl ester carboxylesterase